MGARAYILLNVIEDKTSQVVRVLRSKGGVGIVDVLDGSPNVIMMVEAHDRQRLAELTVTVLASIENMTENPKLLPVRDECNPFLSNKSLGKGRTQKFSTCVPGGNQA